MRGKKFKLDGEDPLLHFHPPQVQPHKNYQPSILTTRFDKLMYAAPGFLDFLALVDVPKELCEYKVAQIIAMPELVSDSRGRDVTWLALKLFLLWLHGEDGKPVTKVDGQKLSLRKLLEFGSAVQAEGYKKQIQQAIDLIHGKEDVGKNDRALNLKENQGLAYSVETEVGEFYPIPTREVEAEDEFQYVDHPESENDSDWSTEL